MFATRVHTRRRSFATARSITKLKPPLCSAESKLPIGVKIPFSTKCSKWVIYAEPVTYIFYYFSTISWSIQDWLIPSLHARSNAQTANLNAYFSHIESHVCISRTYLGRLAVKGGGGVVHLCTLPAHGILTNHIKSDGGSSYCDCQNLVSSPDPIVS